MKKYVIIVAGGSGKRMGTDVPKQFLSLKGKPVLMHTIAQFYNYSSAIEILVVLPAHQVEYWESLVSDYNFSIKHRIVHGGEERFFSVKNGLNALENNSGLVAIHDGVRPCVSQKTINACFEKASQQGNAIPYLDISETMRYVEDEKNYSVHRKAYKTIQTPQVFDLEAIQKAYEIDFQESFTDDASVYEKAGHKICLVKGNNENIKITNPFDLQLAAYFLQQFDRAD